MKMPKRKQEEVAFVERSLGDSVICEQCNGTLKTCGDLCNAALSDPCPGFLRIEKAKDDFALVSRSKFRRAPTEEGGVVYTDDKALRED